MTTITVPVEWVERLKVYTNRLEHSELGTDMECNVLRLLGYLESLDILVDNVEDK